MLEQRICLTFESISFTFDGVDFYATEGVRFSTSSFGPLKKKRQRYQEKEEKDVSVAPED